MHWVLLPAPNPTNDKMMDEVKPLQDRVVDVLKTCYDPEIPVNIYDLGLIYEVQVSDGNDIHVRMTLTSPACPVAETLPPEVEQKIREIPDVNSAKVEITFDPQWDKNMMSEEARLELGMW
jgi:FeS assembly SUF system protein